MDVVEPTVFAFKNKWDQRFSTAQAVNHLPLEHYSAIIS